LLFSDLFYFFNFITMKLLNLLLIFSLALICLFSLQIYWLYYTYQLHLRRIEGSVNSIFNDAVEKETDLRFVELGEKAKAGFSNTDVRADSFNIVYNQPGSKGVVSQQLDMVQQLMKEYNIRFNINSFDSIFRLLLQSNRYPFRYQINYTDSTGRITETAGQNIEDGFKTNVLPIINGEKTYAVVRISAPVIFRNMLAVLSISILIFLFIIACMIYEIRIFINQHHLIQIRENFTHALTHDMKTPLATIHSVLIQLENESIYKNPDMRKKFSAIAINQALNLQASVNQILTLAYIEKKQLSLNKQLIDLPEMIGSLIDKFSVKSNKTVEFKTVYDCNFTKVYADPIYLNNAVSNLIDNAIKYSDDPVQIEIKCHAGEKQMEIHVRDNGFGISSTDQLKIFKQFERGAEFKRNRISGFGIGLNYVQQVIETHGGTVTIISKEGVGSDFIITLPLKLTEK